MPGSFEDREEFIYMMAMLDEAVEEVLCLLLYVLVTGAEAMETEDMPKDEAIDYARWVG